MTPRRIQLRRTKGWRKTTPRRRRPLPTRWGNPYSVAEHGQAGAVALYC